jgi:hypothetical protein
MIEIIDKIRFQLEILWIDHPKLICLGIGFVLGCMLV